MDTLMRGVCHFLTFFNGNGPKGAARDVGALEIN